MHRSHANPASPRVLRVECMRLDCGGAAIVVELDRIPERAWMMSLKRALQADDLFEGAQAKFDGRFVYVVGVEGSEHRAQHRVVQALEMPQAMVNTSRSRIPVADARHAGRVDAQVGH